VNVSSFTSQGGVVTRISDRLAQSVGSQRYNMWFDGSARLDFDDRRRRLDVTVPNRFVADWIDKNFQRQLLDAAEHEIGQGVALNVRVDEQSFTSAKKASAAHDVQAAEAAKSTGGDHQAARSPGDGVARLRHCLDDFVVGPSNELAFAAAHSFSQLEAGPTNTLFIHGGCGLGKTHLLQGICRQAIHNQPAARVRYTTAEQFTNEFLAAIRDRRVDPFRRRIRRLDLLAIDDVHFLAGKTATQQEFMYSFDEMDMGGARVAMASDSHPKLIRQFNKGLVSRCMRGMVVHVHHPDTATRIKIIRALAQRRGLSVIDSVIEVLAARCQGSVREMEGTLTKLHALLRLAIERRGGTAAVSGDCVGHAVLRRLIEAERAERPRKMVGFDAIVDTVASHQCVERSELLGQSRSRRIVEARALAVYLVRKLTPMSYPEIAAAMGRSNHSTVVGACQRVEKNMAQGKRVDVPDRFEPVPLAELVDQLGRRICGS